MLEFFYHSQTGETRHNNTVLKHHFTFGDYYQPTKFGRSTLRRADYILLDNDYNMVAQRHYILLCYPFDDIELMLNDVLCPLKHNQLSAFVIPQGTEIKLLGHGKKSLLLCECDIQSPPTEIMSFDFNDAQSHTHINSIDITHAYSVNADNKPFFGLVLSGNISINDTHIGFYDGFYTDTLLEIAGNARILTFSMPVPL